MAIYRHKNLRALTNITLGERLSNQVLISGADQKLLTPKGIFFLEFLKSEDSTVVSIKDGNGDTIATGLTGFDQDHSPLRCDNGIEFVGDVEFAKGFVLEQVLV